MTEEARDFDQESFETGLLANVFVAAVAFSTIPFVTADRLAARGISVRHLLIIYDVAFRSCLLQGSPQTTTKDLGCWRSNSGTSVGACLLGVHGH